MSSKSTPMILGAGAALVGLVAAAWLLAEPEPEPNVVLIVLDTVRADHLSACGYERDTSPVLKGLQETRDAELTCGAIAPGSWTLPAHASFFTGVMPAEHRAHSISSGIDDFSGSGNRGRPLDESLPTLAEEFAERGYQTGLFSANPVVSDAVGLTRGFQDADIADRFSRYGHTRFVKSIDLFLDHRDRSEPQFMVINIADAHQPWAVPSPEVDWYRYGQAPTYDTKDPSGEWARFNKGELEPLMAEVFVRKATEAYDYGIWLADRNLGYTLGRLEELGYCEERGCRVVITSDHGELLGEEGRLDHGHTAHQANTQVPLMVVNLGPDEVISSLPKPALPELLSGVVVHDLLLNGTLPETMPRVEHIAWPHARRCAKVDGKAFCNVHAALWTDDGQKFTWEEGQARVVDLNADPLEKNPTVVQPDPALQALADIAKAEEWDGSEPDQSVIEMLTAAGYLD